MNNDQIKKIVLEDYRNIISIDNINVVQEKEAHTTTSVYTIFTADVEYVEIEWDFDNIVEKDGKKFATKIEKRLKGTASGQVRNADHSSILADSGITVKLYIDDEDVKLYDCWVQNIGYSETKRVENARKNDKVVSVNRVTSAITKVDFETETVFYFDY